MGTKTRRKRQGYGVRCPSLPHITKEEAKGGKLADAVRRGWEKPPFVILDAEEETDKDWSRRARGRSQVLLVVRAGQLEVIVVSKRIQIQQL